MSPSTITDRTPALATRLPLTAFTRILVATDGLERSDAAVAFAANLAARDEARVELALVRAPISLLEIDVLPAVRLAAQEMAVIDDMRARIDRQRARTHTDREPWTVRIEVGQVAETIQRIARYDEHELVILGLGEDDLDERCVGPEMALQVMRRVRAPVLAVAQGTTRLPRRVLVGVDFSHSSLIAARSALRILRGSRGTLVLAHVSPRVPLPHGGLESNEEFYAAAMTQRYDAFERVLETPEEVDVERVALHGDPAAELLRFATESQSELIAAGSHGRSTLGRLVMGSVSTELVRGATCSVIVARGQ